MVKYTGVGSRSVPVEEGVVLRRFATVAVEAGYVLRSGAAAGSDTYFEHGCDQAGGRKEVYLPFRMFRNNVSSLHLDLMERRLEASRIAASVHPNWSACSAFAKQAHTRNVFQVLGESLSEPSAFLVCWTPNGEIVGGTATAIMLARRYHVPVYNIGNHKARALIEGWAERRAFDVWLGRD